MAESASSPSSQRYNFSPGTITGQDYQTIKSERDSFMQKQHAATNEFMFQHYARLLRALDVSYERATKAHIVLERKGRREEAKKKRDSLKVVHQRK